MLRTAPKYLLSKVRGNSESGPRSGFRVEWSINPHMQIGSTSLDAAESEHNFLAKALREEGASICQVPFLHGDYDSVFIKDDAILVSRPQGPEALLCRPRFPERRREPILRAQEFEKLGIQVAGQTANFLEGGDTVICPARRVAYLGYGFRSSPDAAAELEDFLGMGVAALELRDPHFYHLDTAMNLTVGNDGQLTLFAYPQAFTPAAWEMLMADARIQRIIRVPHHEAMGFALNWVEEGNTILMGTRAPRTRSALESLGKVVRELPLEQFQKAGGSAACLVAPVYTLGADDRAKILS